MPKDNVYIGKRGEETAANYLIENGYRILARNYKTRLGEIDIIGKDKDTLAFVEVKTRSTDRFGSPCDAISPAKRRQISKVATIFLKENNLLDKKARFDVVSISYPDKEPRLDLIKDAFESSYGL